MIPSHPLRIPARLVLAGLVLAASLPCSAQLTLQLKPAKKELVAFEPVRMLVSITNNSGQSILLARSGGAEDAWLAFHVTRDNGEMLQPSGSLAGIQPMMLKPGQSIERTIDVGLLYPLSDFGGYVVRAQAWCPADNAWAASNNVRINVVSARTVWSQSFGVPKGRDGGGSSRTFRLQQFRDYDGSKLYLRLEDRASGMVLACYPIGTVMEMHPPAQGVDSQGNLHVLFVNAPSISTHIVIDSSGRPVARSLFRDVVGNRPVLERDSTGGLVVLGGRTFDPAAEAAQRLIVRRLSERPPGLLALIREALDKPQQAKPGGNTIPPVPKAGQ